MIIHTQLHIMEQSLTISANAGYAEDFAMFLAAQAVPVPQRLTVWKRIASFLGFAGPYDVTAWSAQCIALQCGFMDPNGNFHPISKVAPLVIRRHVQGL